MADFAQIHSKIANALQFLGPLVELEAALREVGGAQKFLLDAQPTIASLKQEITQERDRLASLRKEVVSELSLLEHMEKEGTKDVRARVASVEAQLSQDLKRLQGEVRAAEVLGEQTRRRLLQEMSQLAEQRDRLLADVGSLDTKRERLLNDLAKIARDAGGA